MKLDEFWKRFKSVVYGDVHMAAVVYIDLSETGVLPELGKKALVFSGVTSRGRSSTINCAEEIVAIAEQEGINVAGHSRDFYDLQTYKGHSDLKPRNFVLNKVSIHHSPPTCTWSNVSAIPKDFQNIFHNLIG